jgi:hypothetical protein
LGLRVRFLTIATTFVILSCLVAGCRRPPAPLARDGGSLNLDTLSRYHPAWSQVEALEAKIRRLDRAPAASTLPPLPADAASPRAGSGDTLATGISDAERREIERLTRERVESDYQALLARLAKEVGRYEAVQRANALAEADAALDARRERFAAEYAAIARRYADPLGDRILRLLALEPSPVDSAFYSPEERDHRAEERARLQKEIDDLRASRQKELDALRSAYETDVATLRERAMTQAREATRRYEAERRAQLRESRDRQQVRAQQDLERALAGDEASTLPVGGGALGDPQAEAVAKAIRGRVAQAGASSGRVAGGASQAQARARRQLEAERNRLITMIRESTRALAEAVAAEGRVVVRFDDGPADPEFTRQMISLMEQRWHTDASPSPGARS